VGGANLWVCLRRSGGEQLDYRYTGSGASFTLVRSQPALFESDPSVRQVLKIVAKSLQPGEPLQIMYVSIPRESAGTVLSHVGAIAKSFPVRVGDGALTNFCNSYLRDWLDSDFSYTSTVNLSLTSYGRQLVLLIDVGLPKLGINRMRESGRWRGGPTALFIADYLLVGDRRGLRWPAKRSFAGRGTLDKSATKFSIRFHNEFWNEEMQSFVQPRDALPVMLLFSGAPGKFISPTVRANGIALVN